MSITKEEMNEIIVTVIERVMIRLPQVVGNLQMSLAETSKLTKNFYNQYPDFKKDPASVQSVLSELDKANAGMKYEDILEKSVPMIRERMKMVNTLDVTGIADKSNLNLNISMRSNGEI